MKADLTIALLAMLLSWQTAYAQNPVAASNPAAAPTPAAIAAAVPPIGCTKCAAAAAALNASGEAPALRPIPGTNETMLVGRVENLVPIAVLTVLGCENCSAQAVNWAVQQGSSFDDIERTLRTVAAMRKLDCFKGQFGPEAGSRMEKPLAAAQEALDRAKTRAAK